MDDEDLIVFDDGDINGDRNYDDSEESEEESEFYLMNKISNTYRFNVNDDKLTL
jgi:hypothetical protein